METIMVKVRKWGNSKGVVLPAELGLQAGEDVILNVQRTKNMLKAGELFGKLKSSQNTARSMKEIDKELDSEW